MAIEDAAARLGEALKSKHAMLATAESCTGGGVAYAITAIPGSSHWFERGFVIYTNQSKIEMLGVDASLIDKHGAVSEPVARALAEGALSHSHADYSLAITGIAGPGGGTEDKPVGTVWFAWAGKDCSTTSSKNRFDGERNQVRELAIETALNRMAELIRD
jgi:nicotinamide-nucleotide amidase